MSNGDFDSLHSKVRSTFEGVFGERGNNLDGSKLPTAARSRVMEALLSKYDQKTAERLAIHLTDWNGDAAFIVALLLFPERFSDQEIRDGIEFFLGHAPNHIREACRLTDTCVWEDFPYDD